MKSGVQVLRPGESGNEDLWALVVSADVAEVVAAT
jgi:hypothetical protein